MAINANTGDIVWRVPLGTNDDLEAKGTKNTGAFGQGGSIATAGGLVFIAGTNDKRFRRRPVSPGGLRRGLAPRAPKAIQARVRLPYWAAAMGGTDWILKGTRRP
jgi:glucose dehydrogenase